MIRKKNFASEILIGQCPATFETREPNQGRCCLCGQRKPIQVRQPRPTGAGGRIYLYPFCEPCWADYDEQCNRPMELPALLNLARRIFPETVDYGEIV